MMSSFFSAVSGLKSQTTSLNVIANNISNVNTTGYKSQRVTFSDLLSQTLSSASGATATTGGTNAMQVGLGVSVASTDTNMSTGSTQSTGVSTDIAISGSGFLVVTGGSEGQYQYTREGDLAVDEEGNLNVTGYKVCGWDEYTVSADGNYVFNTDGDVEPLNLYSGNKKNMAAKQTTSADFTGNLDSDAYTVASTASSLYNVGSTVTDFDQTSDIAAYDAQGNKYTVTVNWKKCYVDSTDADNPVTSWYWEATSGDGATVAGSGYVKFDKNGTIITDDGVTTTATYATLGTNSTGYTLSDLSSIGLTAGSYTVSVADNATSGYDLTLKDSSGATVATISGSADGSGTFTDGSGNTLLTLGAGTVSAGQSMAFTVTSATNNNTYDVTPSVTLTPDSTVGTAPFTIALDFSAISTNSNTGSITGDPDGYAAGTLQSISIESDGTITGTYSNGENQPLGMLALATFTNDEGLKKSGDNLYIATNNSGTVAYVSAGEGGTSSLSTGCLEMSNVDLAQEFSQMMISQRAYQANSKVITTSDEMLQSLINMVS